MMLWRSMEGFIFAFGFDMVERKAAPNTCCWCDPLSQEWEATVRNQAGSFHFPMTFDPSKITQDMSNQIIVEDSGYVVEINYLGPPLVWGFFVYTRDAAVREGVIGSKQEECV